VVVNLARTRPKDTGTVSLGSADNPPPPNLRRVKVEDQEKKEPGNEVWDEEKHALRQLIDESKLLKRKRGRPRGKPVRKYQQDLVLNESDERVLTMLCTGMNKETVAQLEGITRKDLYRLLDSKRLSKIKGNAENRLNALLELVVMVIHKSLLNGDVGTALTIAKGFGILKQNKDNEGNKKYKTTLERILERDGKETQRITKEETVEDADEQS
jgi:hypothetical protein